MFSPIKIITSRYLINSIFLSLALALVTTQASANPKNKRTAIINAMIIDGNGELPIEKGTIIIKGDTIESVGTDVFIPDDAVIIDADGKTAMPGLADMHVHLSWGGEGFDVIGYQRRLNALMYAGVTTVLDLGGVLPLVQQMRQAIEADKIMGPHIYYVGPLIDSVDPQWPAISRSMTSESQAKGITTYLKNNQVDAIKAYAKLTRAQIVALVQQGKKQDLPVFVDAWFANGAEHLITTGLHAFAHTPRRVTEETLKIMKKRGVQIITTRAVGGVVKHAHLRGPNFLQNDLIYNTTPPWLLEKAKKDVKRALSDSEYALNHFSKPFHQQLQQNIKRIFDASIPIVAGTDNDGLFSGDELHFELELLVDAGLTPLQAITTATKNAATLMDDEEEWGTIEAGKRADIILIDGRLDLDISETRKIVQVFKNGKMIDRNKLPFDETTDSGIRDTQTNN